ncbi:unnamed protein product [Discula destructiva]
MTTSNVGYAAAVLAIYLVLLIPAIYTTIKHGFKAMAWLGWVYFLLFCSLRIIGSALQIADPTSTGAAIISSVGLSPLTIAVGGVLHEARYYLLSLQHNAEKHKLDRSFILMFHLAVGVAIALLAAGASNLQKPSTRADPEKLAKAWRMAGVGALILFAALALVFLGAVYTFLCHRTPVATQQQLAQRLVLAVGVASPLLAVRVVGSAAYYFGKNADMNPVTGVWGIRIGLYLVPEVLAACVLLVGGLLSRNVAAQGFDAVLGGEDGHKMNNYGY